MIVRSFKDIEGTDRHVKAASGTWESKRIVLAKEKVGFSLHETILYAGTETSMWYANHIEAVVCVEGEAELTDNETGQKYTITPGTMYLLDGHERHTMRIKKDFRCICVFNPPVTGREDHDENGVYLLLTEPEPRRCDITLTTTVTDLYPSRGATEVSVPRQDPVVWGTPDAPGPISVAGLQAYERDGFLPVEQLIPDDEVAVYRQELEQLVTDPAIRADERSVIEPKSKEIRSVFEVHRISEVFAKLVRDERVVGRARQILGSDVYVHQSRINVKPGFGASGFYWHSDFETWHAEDGLPNMRTVSVSIALTENYDTNGGLMIMPGSHRMFLGCAGATPKDNYKQSLQMQDAGTPSDEALTAMASEYGIKLFTGKAGSATWFDCNCMHGSGDNITPFPRSNVFIVFNSVENAAVKPFAAPVPRPTFIGARDFTPVR